MAGLGEGLGELELRGGVGFREGAVIKINTNELLLASIPKGSI